MHLDNFLWKGSVRSCEHIINVSINNSQGRDGRYHEPGSTLVVNAVKRLNIFPRAACVRMLFISGLHPSLEGRGLAASFSVLHLNFAESER